MALENMEESMSDSQGMPDSQQEGSHELNISLETPAPTVFVPPSIDAPNVTTGVSYLHYSPIPSGIGNRPVSLGVDEAGRGPVLGPMVYALLYLPLDVEKPLLKDTHNFLDSKVLTPTTRSNLMQALCTPGSDLHTSCGWATNVLSARDISANMLKPGGATYNLNAQAMDATVEMIQGVFDRGVNIAEIYVDTIGKPETYQKKLERIFPQAKITVAKKADALYPCVSAASVCAKVTRDAALETCWDAYREAVGPDQVSQASADGWGSGYPSDARCTKWLKQSMHPVFGWGPECRFSWGTAKDMLEAKGAQVSVDWPEEEGDDGMQISKFFVAGPNGVSAQDDVGQQVELATWFGQRVSEEVF